MSEFSQTYHLRSEAQQEAADLLRRAGARGFVFPPSGDWVTFVVESEFGDVHDGVVGANQKTLLHYVHAEDHGWEFSVFEGPTRVSHYVCLWEEDIEINDDDLDIEVIERLPTVHSPKASGAELRAILYPSDLDAIFEDLDTGTPADRFTRLIGLEHASWVSWHYVTTGYDMEERTPGLLEVPASGDERAL